MDINKLFERVVALDDYVEQHKKVLIYMGEGQHKIKRKAEQIACNEAIKTIDTQFNNDEKEN